MNILDATGKVKIENKKEKYLIFSENVTYNKNLELFLTKQNSKAIDQGVIVTADNFRYDKNKNILNANGKVFIEDKVENYTVQANDITFNKKLNKIFTIGKTDAKIQSKYNFLSNDVQIDRNLKELKSNKNTTLTDDNFNIYKLSNFIYFYEKKFLKGKNVEVETNSQSEKNDKFFFSNGFFNFLENSFVSKDTKVNLNKKLFDKERELDEDQKNIFMGQNDPRIYSVSSKGNDDKVVLNKAIFTSCKNNDDCPAWSIKADKITHDRVNQNIHYKNAILNIYDVPVFYFPKFFHPDPSVERRSGLLQPRLNNSNVLGSSLNLPYFNVISDNKDITFKPTIFDDRIYMFQNEYRQENKNSSFIADFSYLKGYQSKISGNDYSNRNSISHLFSKFNLDLGLKDFTTSKLGFFLEKVNNDTYLKVFEHNLFPSPVLPQNKNTMQTSLDYNFEHEKYNFSTGLQIYENLGVKHSDRYQFVLPSYNFSKNLDLDKINGSVNLSSSGSNNLKNTNNLTTSITNDISYNSTDYLMSNGLKNNFNFYVKNLNSVGKNDSNYTSSPSIDGMAMFELFSSIPLIRINDLSDEILTPKISFRVNPVNNMIDHSSSNKIITANNAFSINRLGISDSFEAGKSLTLGLDYKIDYKNKEFDKGKEKFLEFKLATVIRDKFEGNIPLSSTIDKKNSNLFGSIQNNLLENINIGYDFSIDNDLKTFESHSLNTEISINNFVTNFYYTEQRAEIGTSHILSNTTKYNLDDNNSFSFSTRRNKAISLTEYYDLAYQYKNDCLTAAIKYNRTFYEDNDLKPSENLFLTVTLIPLTTYERRLYESDQY